MVNVLTEISSLDSIKKDWNRLADLRNNPLLCYDWFLSSAKSFYADGDLRVVTISSGTNTHAIAPLVNVQRRGHKHLECIGVDFLGEPCDLLYDDKNTLQQLLEALIGLGNPVILQRMPSDTAGFCGFNTIKGLRALLIKINSASSAYLPINGSWENSLSPRRKRDLKTARNRLSRVGAVHVEIICPTNDMLPDLMEKAFLIENAGWKGKQGSSMLSKKPLGTFFQTYSTFACQEGILRICFLYASNRAVAMLIGLEYARRFWVLKIGYDEAYADYSPGIQLIDETIKYAFSNYLHSYEFLGANEPWIHMWHVTLRHFSSIGIYPINCSSLFSLSSNIYHSGCTMVRKYLKTNR